MPTIVGHALVAAGVLNFARPLIPPVWRRSAPLIAATLAMMPDADVLGFRWGIEYGAHFGHRGASHSLVFAAVTACLGLGRLKIQAHKDPQRPRGAQVAFVYALLFLAAATHPLLDMLTDGGLGVALLAPWSWSRLFFHVTPIPVSPIGIAPDLLPVMTWEMAFFLPFFLGSLAAHSKLGGRARALAAGLGLAASAGAFLFRLGF